MTNIEMYYLIKSKNGGGGSTPTPTPTPADVPYKDYPVQVEIDNLSILPANAFNGLINLKGAKLSGLSKIGAYAFYGCNSLLEIDVPSSVTSIGEKAIGYDESGQLIDGFVLYGNYGTAAEEYALENSITFADKNATFTYSMINETDILITKCSGGRIYVVVPRFLDGYKVTQINDQAFNRNTRSLIIRNGVEKINFQKSGDPTSWGMPRNLTKLFLPNTLINGTDCQLGRCTSLSEIIFEEGFNIPFDCSACPLSEQVIVAMLNSLADRSEITAMTLTLGSTNLAKLSNEQVAIATEKNWTLA